MARFQIKYVEEEPFQEKGLPQTAQKLHVPSRVMSWFAEAQANVDYGLLPVSDVAILPSSFKDVG